MTCSLKPVIDDTAAANAVDRLNHGQPRPDVWDVTVDDSVPELGQRPEHLRPLIVPAGSGHSAAAT
jgi:hypothetical protein